MKRLSAALAAILVLIAHAAPALPFRAAMAELAVPDPQGERPLEGFVWYPTEAAGPVSFDFESEVWEGSEVIRDAEPAAGAFPLLVVSHGMFGNAYNQAWFANAMAQRGYVVAAISHPGTSTWLRDPDQRRALWERARDITRVIDHLTGSTDRMLRVDPDRIYMAGHSLGGFTAALAAGARFDASALARFCDKTPGELACGIFADWEIAQTPKDRVRMEADLSDPRIRAFALFDLGGTQSFSEQSLARIDRPLLVFGAPIMNSGLTLDIESRALVGAVLPEFVTYLEPPTLSHFDFLGQCRPGGMALLAREEPGDEIICDGGGAARAEKHRMIVEAVAAFFAEN